MGTATLAARLLLAGIFAMAAVTKLADPAASRATFDGFGVSARIARVGAATLAPAELLVFLALLFTPTARWGANVAVLLLLVFIAGMTHALRQGRTPDCGCFGALRPTPIGPSTMLRNVGLLAIALFAAVTAPGPAIDRWVSGQSAAAVATTLALVALAIAALVLLPSRLAGAPVQATAADIKPPSVGQQPPDFVLLDVEGAERTAQSLHPPNAPLVLVFASATCGSCVKLFPSLARWQGSFAPRLGLAVIVSGEAEAAGSISEQHGITEVLVDPRSDVSRAYGISAQPCALSMTPDGRVAHGPAYGADAIEELLRSTLERAEPISTPWLQTTSAV